MKQFLFILIVMCAVLGFTNPSQDEHQRRFREQFRADNPILGFLGVGELASHAVAYEDYVLFSVGRVGESVVTIGALGMVGVQDLDL